MPVGSLTIDSSGLSASSGAPPSLTQTTAGADAAYTLDGVSLTSASNTVSTALKGVTFQLLQTTGSSTSTSSSVVAQVVADTSSVSTSLGSFVSAYNTLVKALAAQETNDSTGAAEPLFGNPLISQIQSSLSAALSATNVSSASSAGTPLSLISLGITTGVDGTLSARYEHPDVGVVFEPGWHRELFSDSGELWSEHLTRRSPVLAAAAPVLLAWPQLPTLQRRHSLQRTRATWNCD